MIHLTVGRLQLDWGKNSGFADHSPLFLWNNLTEVPYYYAGDTDDPECSQLPLINRDENFSYRLITEMKAGLAAPLWKVAERLSLLGYTREYCQQGYQAISESIGDFDHDFDFNELATMLSQADLSTLATEPERGDDVFGYAFFHEILPALGMSEPEKSRFPRCDQDIDGLSSYSIMQLLSTNPTARNLPVTWKFADVEEGGWAKREIFVRPLSQADRFLIVTEGTTDAKIIKHAVGMLRPHIADFFDFVDMQEGYPFSGTGSLFNFVKGLISIRIQNNVVVLYDNNAEGVFNWCRSTKLRVLDNMRILKLPDREAFRDFQTVGPSGLHKSDINGKAAAIECYLDTGPDPVVRWSNFHTNAGCYQGQIENKDRYTQAFLAQNARVDGYDYSGIASVLDLLVAQCVSIRKASRSKELDFKLWEN